MRQLLLATAALGASCALVACSPNKAAPPPILPAAPATSAASAPGQTLVELSRDTQSFAKIYEVCHGGIMYLVATHSAGAGGGFSLTPKIKDNMSAFHFERCTP